MNKACYNSLIQTMEVPNIPGIACAICKKPATSETGESHPVSEIGAAGINNAALQRKNDNVSVSVGDIVHNKCHREFTNKWYINKAQKSAPGSSGVGKRKMRSAEGIFDSKRNCLYCEKEIKIDAKTKKRKGHDVQTQDFENKLREKIEERNDDWAIEVLGRLNSQPDCFAADNCYHHECDRDFRLGKPAPHHLKNKTKRKGRPVDDKQIAAVETALGYRWLLENH